MRTFISVLVILSRETFAVNLWVALYLGQRGIIEAKAVLLFVNVGEEYTKLLLEHVKAYFKVIETSFNPV